MNKKLISVLLSIITVITCCSVCAVSSNAKTSAPIPTIYIQGQGGKLYYDCNDKDSELIYPLDLNKDILINYAMSLNNPFAKALATGDWSDWCDTFVGIVTEIFEPIALDKGGNPVGTTGSLKSSFNINKVNKDGSYDVDKYVFKYDWRLDAEDVIDELHDNIKTLIKATDAKKVNLIGRCIGANVAVAYLNKYGNDLINNVILYCFGFDGFDLLGKVYTGEISFDSKAISRFSDDYLTTNSDFASPETITLISDIINIFFASNASDFTLDILKSAYAEIYENIIPRVLRETYGRYPSFWGLIGPNYYEKAKNFIFSGYEDEYSELIEKTDYFQYNVLTKTREIIDETISNGTNVYIVAKYGLQIVPVIEETNIQSDAVLEVSSASGGAVCSSVLGKFSDDYIQNAKQNGTIKYISPDYQIDSSSAFLPDHTWYIKNCSHMNMPNCVNELFAELLSSDKYITVFDNENFPQYMYFDNEQNKILPLTPDHPEINPKWKSSVFSHIISFFKIIFNYISKLFSHE